MMRAWPVILVCAAACGGDNHHQTVDANELFDVVSDVPGGGSVTAHAKIYNGATPAGMAFALAPAVPPPPAGSLEDGQWLITPKTLKRKLVGVSLSGSGPLVTPVPISCDATWDQTQPGLTQLNDCPFTVEPGTYDTVNVTFDSTLTAVVEDVDAGIYSTTNGLVTTPPGGGVQPFTYGGSTQMTSSIKLAAPLTVAAGDTLDVSIVFNGLQSLRFTASSGVLTPGVSILDVVASVGTLAKIKTYVSPQLNTAGSYCAAGCTSPPPGGITSLTVYYTSPTTAKMVGLTLNGTPSTCAQVINGSFINNPKGYVGLDTSNVVGWATAGAPDYASYSALFAMPQATNIGDSAELYCSNTSTDPMPTGGSFASGAPAIQTAGNSLGTYTLVAQ